MRFLGAVTGLSGAFTNAAQSSGMTGFVIPPWVKQLYLQPSASGLFFEIGSTGLQTSDVRGAVVPSASLQGPFRAPSVAGGVLVAVYSTQGSFNVRVYGTGGA